MSLNSQSGKKNSKTQLTAKILIALLMLSMTYIFLEKTHLMLKVNTEKAIKFLKRLEIVDCLTQQKMRIKLVDQKSLQLNTYSCMKIQEQNYLQNLKIVTRDFNDLRDV